MGTVTKSVGITRRDILRGGGALIVSIAAAHAADHAASGPAAGASVKPALLPPELDSWIAIKQSGDVIAYFGKVDVGLGIYVAIGQIVADELDVPYERVTVVMGDTAQTCNQGGASGSTGLELGSMPLRNAAAEARSVLLQMAARKFAVPASGLQVSDGIVSVTSNAGQHVSFGELIGGRFFDVQLTWNGKLGNALRVTGNAKPKDHADYKIVGKSIPRSDIANKIFGEEVFITDMRVPGMMHGRMIRPAVAGTVPVSVDKNSITSIPNVQIVWKSGLLGVVAESEWNAIRAAQELKVGWSTPGPGFPAQATLYETMKATAPGLSKTTRQEGDVDQALSGAAHVMAGEYHWPFQSHACMGPACAIVDAKPGAVTLYTGDQKPHYARDGVARLLGVPAESVHGIWLRGPGSYGRNDSGDAAMDAAVLSHAVGRPVRVQYMRADATGWDPKGPASVHQVKAGMDDEKNIVALEYLSRAFSVEDIASHPDDPSQSLAGQLMGMQGKSTLNFESPAEGYDFPNQKLGWDVIPGLRRTVSPLRTSHLRDPLGPQLNFASESFMDEMALAAQSDPVAFRLKYLKDPKAVAVLEAAARLADWQPQVSGSRAHIGGATLTGRGVAYAKRGGTRVAVITEIEINRDTGRVWPRRWFVAHDCGLVVNPVTLKLVIEGNIIHATSRALFEEVNFDERNVTSVDWITYPILLMQDAPETIDIVLINHENEMPLGAGEPSSRPVAAAIANAIHDATGIRIREAPLTKSRIKAALT
jgi:CO/xanthine dehydrogenase Mo-binding subunit